MELPCLAFHHRDRSTALFSVSGGHRRIVSGDTDDLLRNKTVCPTAWGLLLVRDPDTMATFLWNPHDGDQLHLPPLEGVDDAVLMYSHCLLSDKPSASGCVVLLVEPEDTLIWYCHPGDDNWVKHDYDIGSHVLPHYPDEGIHTTEKHPICPIAACRGKFYFNSTSTELGVLEFCPDPVFSSITIDGTIGDEEEGCEDEQEYDDTIRDEDEEEYDDTIRDEDEEEYKDEDDYYEDEGPSRRTAVFLVGSGDELYRVSLLYVAPYGDDEIGEGFVEKMDFSERRWRSVDGLGGRTFLLSQYYFGASCSGGECGLQQDCVYVVYARKEMQVFNVKKGTNELQKLDEAPTSGKAFWLLPAYP
ncbi:hypothetical protein ACP70R_038824 [Stipagrostis hirtigluma subsp. patula]